MAMSKSMCSGFSVTIFCPPCSTKCFDKVNRKKFHGAAIVEIFSMIVKQKTLAFRKNFRKIESTQILEALWKR